MRRIRQTAHDVVVEFPPAANGLALGLCGATTLAVELAERYTSFVRLKSTFIACGTIAAACLWVAFGLRTVLRGRRSAREELKKPAVVSCYAAFGLVYLIGCERLARTAPIVARTFAKVGFALQPMISVSFLMAAFSARAPVEPYWNPALLNSFVVSAVGSAVFGRKRRPEEPPCSFVVSASFIVALTCLAIVLPLQAWRVLVRKPASLKTAAVAAMMTPCSIWSISTGVLLERGYFLPHRGCVPEVIATHRFIVYDCSQALSVLVVWITVYALIERREALATFSLNYVALVTPSCVSAAAALVYANSYKSRSQRTSKTDSSKKNHVHQEMKALPTSHMAAHVFEAYASLVAATALTLTIYVALRLAMHATAFAKDIWKNQGYLDVEFGHVPVVEKNTDTIQAEQKQDAARVDNNDRTSDSNSFDVALVKPPTPLSDIIQTITEQEKEAGDTLELPRRDETHVETPPKGDYARALLSVFDNDIDDPKKADTNKKETPFPPRSCSASS